MASPARQAAGEESRIDSDFRQRYQLNDQGPTAEIEKIVFGTDFGASGYTTLTLADRLLEELDLSPSHRVLDIGTGCGWPGLRAALEDDCHVVGTDLPLEGLARAMTRARLELAPDRFSAVRCSARRLPFKRGSFDAVLHTDVLC